MFKVGFPVCSIRFAVLAALVAGASNPAAAAETDSLNSQQRFAREVYQELVQINTTASVGDTYQAAQAMAARLKSAGFADAEIHVFQTAPKRGDLVARLRGTGKRKPILLMAHID